MPSAYIDLKNCQFFIQGGTSSSDDLVGAVNLMAGYAIGAVTMVVDGFTTALVVGYTFTFATHSTIYTITAHTETSMATTSITFTPPLTAAVVDNAVITVNGPLLEVTIGEGNLTFDEKRALEYKKNRGKLDVVRLGDEDPVDVNFQFAWTYLSSATGDTVPTVEEALKQTGVASTWITTGLDCEPYAVNIILLNTPVNCGALQYSIERITLPDFRYTSLAHDPKAGTVTCQGTCNVTNAIRERLMG